jgi:hypothetical protein
MVSESGDRPRMERIGRIHTDLIRPDPSDPPNPWSISHPNLASCLTQLDSNALPEKESLSMLEVTHPGEYHRYIVLVGRRYHLFIAH